MKSLADMSLGELAAFVWTHLHRHGINCVLTGGACVSIYTTGCYQSYDLDFVERVPSSRKRIREALVELGFFEESRYFKHPETKFFLEFPAGPLSVGSEPVKATVTLEFPTGQLALLSPTDCVKDRLAAYYNWNDLQSLEQALLVAQSNRIDIGEVRRWSDEEGKLTEFETIKQQLLARRNRP
jgi:hypothetical protein